MSDKDQPFGVLRNPALLAGAASIITGDQDDQYRDGAAEVLQEALLTGNASGAIEAQEARGQQMLVTGDMLPKQINCTREQLEAIGFQFGENADDLFVRCTLPPGWTKQAADHAMHSKILDERGRERISIFFKAAFYDRRADAHVIPRFRVTQQPVGGWENAPRIGKQMEGVVLDGKTVIFRTDATTPEPVYGNSDGERKAYLEWHSEATARVAEADTWLASRYPNWRDPFAYWDE